MITGTQPENVLSPARPRRPAGVFALLTVFLILSGCEKKGESPPDKPVATVGRDIITYGEFKNALALFVPGGGEGMPQNERTELRKNLINRMIEEKLVLDEAGRRGITVSSDEVSREVKALWRDPADERSILERYGTTDKWKEEIRKKLLIKKTVEAAVRSAVRVTEKEAMGYYDKNRSRYEMPGEVRARMIMTETEEKAKEAERLLLRERFEDVARKMSAGPEAAKGGDLGFFGRGEMPPEFEDVVFKLTAGRISPIVKTPYGYHIFRVEGVKKARTLRFKEVKGEIMDRLAGEKSEEGYRDWILSLKKNAGVKVDEAML